MSSLDPASRAEVSDDFTRGMYDFMFGDRDPVAEPGAVGGPPATGGLDGAVSRRHAVPRFRLYREEVGIRADYRELGQIRAGWAVGSQFVFPTLQGVPSGRGAGREERSSSVVADR